jgi:hypothetical protein
LVIEGVTFTDRVAANGTKTAPLDQAESPKFQHCSRLKLADEAGWLADAAGRK